MDLYKILNMIDKNYFSPNNKNRLGKTNLYSLLQLEGILVSMLRMYSEHKIDQLRDLPISEIYKSYIKFKDNNQNNYETYKIEEIYDTKKRHIAELLSIMYNPGFEIVNKMMEEIKSALREMNYKFIEVRIKTSSKTLVGVSTNFGYTIFENGISFDPYLNVPYIPASEIKGLLRSMTDDEKLADKLFGSEESEGILMITDSYPIQAEGSIFLPDIITPHYVNAEDESRVQPKPSIRFVIAPKVTFDFFIYYKNLDTYLRKVLEQLIIKMIKEGIGSKTSLGYSLFTVVYIDWTYGE